MPIGAMFYITQFGNAATETFADCYCDSSDLERRLGPHGVRFTTDLNSDGVIGSAEENYVNTAIFEACAIMDAFVQYQAQLSVAHASGNTFLKMLCVDLASDRLLSFAGTEIPEFIHKNAERAYDWLNKIKANQFVIPNLAHERDNIPASVHDNPRSLESMTARIVNPR